MRCHKSVTRLLYSCRFSGPASTLHCNYALLNARLSAIIVGERPGLSAADSLGVYLTYSPRVGNSDAERNCLSNIRPALGLSYQAAAANLAYLSVLALQRGVSGVALKDHMPSNWLE